MDRSRVARAVQVAAFAAMAFDCFFPYLTKNLPSPGMIMPLLLWISACAELYGPRMRPGAIAAWVSIPVLAGLTSYALSNLPEVVLEPLGTLPATLNQYFFVMPLAVSAGLIVGRGAGLDALASSLRIIGLVSAVLAIAERLTGHLVFSGNVVQTNFGTNGQLLAAALTGSGAVRGIVGSYHPLVLGTLLAAVLPLALARPSRRTWVEAPLLLAGIWATDSVGPLAIAIVICIVRVWHIVRRDSARLSVRAVLASYALAVLAFVALSTWVWTPVVDPNGAVDASTQYRFALFSSLPEILGSHLWGLGFGPLPAGTILLESGGHPIDITASIDSELVVLALQIGIVGVAAFVLVLGLALRNIASRTSNTLASWSLFAITASGLVVALHVWPAITAIWAFLIGVGLASLRRRQGSTTAEVPDEHERALPRAGVLA